MRRGAPAASVRAMMNASGRFNVAEAARRNELFRRADDEVRDRRMPPAAMASIAYDSAADVADLLAALDEQTEARITAQDRAEIAEAERAELQRRITAALVRLAGPTPAVGRFGVLVHDLKLILGSSRDDSTAVAS